MQDQREKLLACLNIIRRLPISKAEENIAALIELCPELEDELYSRVDIPLELETDTEKGEKFIKSEHNRDGDSYRSPYTNKYFPEEEGLQIPSPQARELEVKGNALFNEYKKL